jgi:Domain of unknown function (DUF4442)
MSFAFNEFSKLIKHPIKSRLFLLTKLPAAYFSGVRIRSIDEQQCTVTIPYKWLTRNPFRSTYFASLSMAAEMSTGALSMAYLYKRIPPVSMLVVKVSSEYFKKATGRTRFTCADGKAILATIDKAVTSGEAQSFTCRSVGVNAAGETVAEFMVTWSFKAKLKT